MKKAFFALAFLVLCGALFSYTIDNYLTEATVQSNGGIHVKETITFTLTADDISQMSAGEGYRSIRLQDYEQLSSIHVNSVKVDGSAAGNRVQISPDNPENAEIVWTEVHEGQNTVVLDYTISNRVELYNDFARICYEHYGANWPVFATNFQSRMTLPEDSRGKDMHYQIYSPRQGSSRIDDLTIVVDMNDVPPGNYIGGCYLFARDSVHTSRVVNASALAILQNERESYSKQEPQKPVGLFDGEGSPVCCCSTVFLICLVLGLAAAYNTFLKPKKYPDNLMPPDREEPAVVAALLRNEIPEKDLFASTLVDLINRNIIDIIELEKKPGETMELKRERTILFLKKRPSDLKPYENAVLDLIFSDKKEVDLDQMAEDFKNVHTKDDAKKMSVEKNMETYHSEMKKIIKDKDLWHSSQGRTVRKSQLGSLTFFLVAFSLCIIPYMFSSVPNMGIEVVVLLLISAPGVIILAPLLAYYYSTMKSEYPKMYADEFEKWDAFRRGVQASRLKEYPPGSAVIWGEILTYATALGLADKVEKHLSELDALIVQKVQTVQRMRPHMYAFYASALEIENLASYGSRSGPSTGGFSSGSSGGWSSGGGGGFSGGSSGGGGFR